MVSNPTEFRSALVSIFETSPLTVSGQTFGSDVTNAAIDEIVSAMAKSYLKEGEPTACEKIVGAFFIGLIERNQ
jgi:hypothetical protein